MPFAAPSGGIIVQSGTDDNLSGLSGNSAVTVTHDGIKVVYTILDNRLRIDGTLTIDPSIERLVITENFALEVSNGGTLNLGRDLVKTIRGDDFTRFSPGVALVLDRAPNTWFGGSGFGTNMRVSGSGNLNWRGAEIEASGSLSFLGGSRILIQDGILTVRDIRVGDTDPVTGATVAAQAGIYTGTSSILPEGRGFISWFLTNNIAVRNFTVRGGGEYIFGATPSGTNGVDSSFENTILGYRADATTVATFPNRVQQSTFLNTNLAGTGNDVDMTVQTEGLAAGVLTTTNVVNEASGTLLRCLGGEAAEDARNRGIVTISRDINFNFIRLDNAQPITDNGRWFIRDNDNGYRSPGFGRVDDVDRVYSNTFTNGSSVTTRVLLGSVKVTNAEYTIGDQTIAAEDRDRGAFNNAVDGNEYAMDLRGKLNTLGSDLFDIHIWHVDHLYRAFINADLSDGTTGTLEFAAALPLDTDYSATDFGTRTTIATLDEFYDNAKQRKVSSAAQMELPTINTLWTRTDGSNIDLSARDLFVLDNDTNDFFTAGADAISVHVGSGNTLSGGNVFTGITTTGDIDVTNIDLSTVIINATNITNLPDVIPAGANLTGTFTLVGGDRTLQFEEGVDVSGLNLVNTGTGDLLIRGSVPNAFASTSNTGTGRLFFPTQYTVDLSNVSGGELTVVRGLTPAGSTTEIDNVLDNEIISVVYSAPGRTDFLQRIEADINDGDLVITPINFETPYPNTTSDNSDLFSLNIFGSGELRITVNRTEPSSGEVSDALQEHVKGTALYNQIVALSNTPDLISSPSATSAATVNSDFVTFVSGDPFSIGFIQDTGTGELAVTTPVLVDGGGEINVGVTILPATTFDPAVTAAQVNDAVDRLNVSINSTETVLSEGQDFLERVIIDANGV